MNSVAARASSYDMSSTKAWTRDRTTSEVPAPSDTLLRQPESAYLPRAASYTYFPHVKEIFEDSSLVELKGTISEDDLKPTTTALAHSDPIDSPEPTAPETKEHAVTERPPVKRTSSRRSSRFLIFSNQDDSPAPLTTPEVGQDSQPAPALSRSASRSMTKLRRKSWISTSRPTSPTKEEPPVESSMQASKSSEAGRRRSIVAATFKIGPDKDAASRESSPTSTRRTLLTKKPKRPLSALLKAPPPLEIPPASSNKVPDVPRLPRSFSSDRLPLGPQSPTSPNQVPPLPRNIADQSKGARTEPRKKDELWSIFRTLEADLRKWVDNKTCNGKLVS